MNNEQEIWKNVEGYDGAYQVSNLGRVRSRKHGEWRLIRPSVDKVGYCRVIFTCNGKHTTRFVHRLVATAFVDGYKDGLTVDHTNGKRTDNSGNQLHAWATGLQRPHYCGGGAERKRRIAMYDMQGRFEQEFPSIHAAARAIGCKWPSAVSAVLSTRPNKRHCKSYKGHRFEYID